MPKAFKYVAQTGFVESLFWTLDGVIFTLILAAKIPKENKTKDNTNSKGYHKAFYQCDQIIQYLAIR